MLARRVRARPPRPPARARLARRRPLAHRPPARAAPLRAREDVDPRVHRRPRRLAARPRSHDLASCRSTASRPSSAATTRWTATARWERTQRAFDAIVDGTGTHAAERRRGGAGELRRPASPTSSSSRSSSTGTPRLEPGDTAIFFNFRPDRARQLTRLLLDARRRPDDDDALRRRTSTARSCSPSRTSPNTLAEVLSRARAAPAARRRDREVRARDVLLQRRPRGRLAGRDADRSSRARATCRATTSSRRCRPTRSPTASVAEVGDGYAFCVVNFANPDMVGHTGSIPAVVAAVETTDRCLGRVVDRVDRARRRLPRHRRPRERRAAARARRRHPAHGAHDEPGAARS